MPVFSGSSLSRQRYSRVSFSLPSGMASRSSIAVDTSALRGNSCAETAEIPMSMCGLHMYFVPGRRLSLSLRITSEETDKHLFGHRGTEHGMQEKAVFVNSGDPALVEVAPPTS